jgi:predicted amidohydrolase YtcJ
MQLKPTYASHQHWAPMSEPLEALPISQQCIPNTFGETAWTSPRLRHRRVRTGAEKWCDEEERRLGFGIGSDLPVSDIDPNVNIDWAVVVRAEDSAAERPVHLLAS